MSKFSTFFGEEYAIVTIQYVRDGKRYTARFPKAIVKLDYEKDYGDIPTDEILDRGCQWNVPTRLTVKAEILPDKRGRFGKVRKSE